MTKKKKILKRIFAFVGVLSILFCMALPFSVGAATVANTLTNVNRFSFDAFSRGTITNKDRTSLDVIDAGMDKIILKTEAGSTGDGMLRYTLTLRDFLPTAKAGEGYRLEMIISNNVDGVGIVDGISVGYGSNDNPNPTYWENGEVRTLMQQDLEGYVTFYGYDSKRGGTSSVDVYTEIRIAIVPEGQTYDFDHYKDTFEYQSGYTDGFEAAKDQLYKEAFENAYKEYLNQNTIVNSVTTSVSFVWCASYYDNSFTECPVETVNYFDYPVYLSYMDNDDYAFDGYSFSTSALSKEDYGFDGVFRGDDDFYLSGLKGVSIFVTTKNNGVYACAGDLPIQLNFGSSNNINSNYIKARIDYTVPAGYSVPADAILIDGVYVCSAEVLKAASNEYGVFSCTAQELFGLEASTPVRSIRVTFVCDSIHTSYFDKGAGIIISNTKNNPAFMAGQSYGASEGFDEGYKYGKLAGAEQGYGDGLRDGKIVGFEEGYREGLKNAKELTFRGLIFAVVDAPVQVFSSMLNFNVLGINLLGFMTSILTIMIVIAVVKVVVK